MVAGVAGSGKSTVGRLVSREIGARFIDGDDLHPPANIAKMAAGHPLDDGDREPWLDAIAATLADPCDGGVVVACSALRRRYRDVLRSVTDVEIVVLEIGPDEARRRLTRRAGHFMGIGMVASQFEALELPEPSEPRAVVIDAERPTEVVVAAIVARTLRRPASAD